MQPAYAYAYAYAFASVLFVALASVRNSTFSEITLPYSYPYRYPYRAVGYIT